MIYVKDDSSAISFFPFCSMFVSQEQKYPLLAIGIYSTSIKTYIGKKEARAGSCDFLPR